MHAKPRIRTGHWLLVGILLLAFALRLFRLGASSLWYDETVSVHLASKSLPALVEHTAGDIHPPGYYVLLHVWLRLVGPGGSPARDLAAAFPSLFFGMLLVALAYRAAAPAFGQRAGILAALLVAVSPYNLWYSQEVRMYTAGAALAVGAILSALRMLLTARSHRPPWRALVVYALCGALGLWMLYYFAFLLAALNLLVVVWWLARRRRPRSLAWAGRWLLAQAAVLLLYAPWLPIAWRQATAPPVPPWRGFTGAGRVLVEVWSALSLGQSVQPARVWPALALVAVLFVLGLVAVHRQGRPRGDASPAHGRTGSAPARRARVQGHGRQPLAWFLAACTFLPIALIFLASYVTPLYHVRYAFTYSTAFYVVLAAGLASVGRRWPPVLWLALATVLAYSGLSAYDYHTDSRYASDDHRGAVAFLAERWRPGDAILVDAGYVYTAVDSYWTGDAVAWRGRLAGDSPPAGIRDPAVYLAGSVDGDEGLGWGEPDSDFYAMSRQETEQALARLFANHDRVWLYRCYDTVTDPSGMIRDWLAAHGTPFEDQVFAGEAQLRVQGFLTGRENLLTTAGPSDGPFLGRWLDLEASRPESREVKAGATLDVDLLWRVRDAPIAQDPVLFAGIYWEGGSAWGSVSERPLGSLLPAVDWRIGDVISTPLRIPIPAGTPPGTYWVHVGWYEMVDGQVEWLPVFPCHLPIVAEIEVVPPDDWRALPMPKMQVELGVTIGDGVRILGMDAPRLEALPGGFVPLTLFWQALVDRPDPGPAVLRLTDAGGSVVAEPSHVPADGLATFGSFAAWQIVRDPTNVWLPNDLQPGIYELALGRLAPDGTWLPVRRGSFGLGTQLPLATVHVRDREVNETPPSVQHPSDARFGAGIRLVGFDVRPPAAEWRAGQPEPEFVAVTSYWQALAGMDTRYKIFLHLTGDGGPADIRAQADAYPGLPTTSWIEGEYLSDVLYLDLPADLPSGPYRLLLGLYDEDTGLRLPVFDANGTASGDSVTLLDIELAP